MFLKLDEYIFKIFLSVKGFQKIFLEEFDKPRWFIFKISISEPLELGPTSHALVQKAQEKAQEHNRQVAKMRVRIWHFWPCRSLGFCYRWFCSKGINFETFHSILWTNTR